MEVDFPRYRPKLKFLGPSLGFDRENPVRFHVGTRRFEGAQPPVRRWKTRKKKRKKHSFVLTGNPGRPSMFAAKW